MSADLIGVHGRCGQQFAALVAGVRPGQWQDGTPCSQWDVRMLVHHLLYEQRWVPPLLDGQTIGQVGDRFEGDLLGQDASAWPGVMLSAIAEAHAAVAQPGALEGTVHLSFGEASGREYVLQLTADLAIHAWDLARATGQDEHLDPAAVTEAWRMLEPLDEAIRRPGGFAPKLEPPTGADEQTELLAFCGRAV